MLASQRFHACTQLEGPLDIAASPPLTTRTRLLERLRAGSNAGNLAAVTSFAVAAFVYVRTLLPGVSFGDWADAQLNPYRLGIMHPTGYPLFVLLGKLFTLIPANSVAWRMNLLSATAAAAVVGVAVLIMVRLGIRPVIAAAAGLALAFTGTLWQEATFSEMNSFHLLLVALLLHRALVWRATRRPRDLLIGAFIGGLCVSNHGLAITVVPIVVLFVLLDARHELARNPWLLVRSGGAFVLGLVPYLYIPLRASFGPADVYGQFLTWDGFFAHVSGAQFRSAMHFLSLDSIGAAAAAMPGVVDDILSLSNVVFLVAGIAGIAILVLRDRWFGLLLAVLGAINVYFYANYNGDLAHYLLASWLILAIGLGLTGEMLVRGLVRLSGPRTAVVAYALFALPIVLFASNYAANDQSANTDGERFTEQVFAALPPHAVLVTYWDALAPLSYKQCVEGVRPDVTLQAYDRAALVTCDEPAWPLTEAARTRPIYGLMVFPESLRAQTGLRPVPEGTIKLPWGKRYPELDRALYRLVPDATP